MTAITITPQNEADYQIFMSLAKRLKAKVVESVETDEPSKEQILQWLGEDYKALKNGTLKTRPLKDVLDEL